MLLPIATNKTIEMASANGIIGAGDVGATKVNLALYRSDGKQLTAVKENTYLTKNYSDLQSLLTQFLAGSTRPDRLSLGVAGPVQSGKVTLTNLAWEIEKDQLALELRIPAVYVINDLEAAAYGLAVLNEKDGYLVKQGKGACKGNAAIIAPGTGLGEAGLYRDGVTYHPFATEGGHCSFAPRTDLDVALYHFLQKKYGHVSWERVISGPGICAIYEFLHQEKEREEPAWLKDLFLVHDPATVISDSAGECSICSETMTLFLRYLAEEAASLALKLNATGGVFIGGGILPKMIRLVHQDTFCNNFCDQGRLKSLLESIPVTILLNPKASLLGAAYYGLHNG